MQFFAFYRESMKKDLLRWTVTVHYTLSRDSMKQALLRCDTHRTL